MIGLYSQLLSKDQKLIIKDSLIMYVCQLQKQYFRDKIMSYDEYHQRMRDIDEITDNLPLKDIYKQDS